MPLRMAQVHQLKNKEGLTKVGEHFYLIKNYVSTGDPEPMRDYLTLVNGYVISIEFITPCGVNESEVNEIMAAFDFKVD